jgi:hypothetical protein
VPAYNYVLNEGNPYFEEADGEHYEEVFSLGPEVERHAVHPAARAGRLGPVGR